MEVKLVSDSEAWASDQMYADWLFIQIKKKRNNSLVLVEATRIIENELFIILFYAVDSSL